MLSQSASIQKKYGVWSITTKKGRPIPKHLSILKRMILPQFFSIFFLSTTETIQFLADNQWQLITVNTEIASDYDNVKDGEGKLTPVTKITSRPVYHFKKEIME